MTLYQLEALEFFLNSNIYLRREKDYFYAFLRTTRYEWFKIIHGEYVPVDIEVQEMLAVLFEDYSSVETW